MQSIEITDEQHERFTAVQEGLAAAHAGEYASVQSTDVMAYLLDLAEAVDDPAAPQGDDAGTEQEAATDSDAESGEAADADEDQVADDSGSADEAGDDEGGTGEASGSGPGMLNLLEDHEEKWREADGDERYEVDLPDGGVETARTRDDVKAILFEHYR